MGLWPLKSLFIGILFLQASGCNFIDKLERNGNYVLDVIFMKWKILSYSFLLRPGQIKGHIVLYKLKHIFEIFNIKFILNINAE